MIENIDALKLAPGIIKTLHHIWIKHWVRLQVMPAHETDLLKTGRYSLCVHAVNRSAFSVTIEEIGVIRRVERIRKQRLPITDPKVFDGKPFPRRLEDRTAVYVHFDFTYLYDTNIVGVYARTSCGVVKAGSSRSFKRLVRELSTQS